MTPESQTAGLMQLGASFVLLVAIYFIPSFIAFGRHHYRRWQIFTANLLLGWTFFLWVYCLVVAFSPGAREKD